jgi:hypothetical protein
MDRHRSDTCVRPGETGNEEAVSRPTTAGTEACSHRWISLFFQVPVAAALCGCRSSGTASSSPRALAAILACLLITAPAFGADPPPAASAPVTAQASVDRSQVTIGDPIRYMVQVTATADTEVMIPVLTGNLGDFTISDFGELPTRKHDGQIVVSRWYTLAVFAPGDHLVPAPKVRYRTAGEELQEVEGNEVLVGVTSLLAREKNPSDIRDIKPPEEVPFDWRPLGIGAAVVVAVGLLGSGLFYLLNRPRRQRMFAAEPPHEVALAALLKLRARHLIEEGKFEEYYVQLSAIVRRYLEDCFRLRAPEMTTEEFLLAVASEGRLAPPHRQLLGEFLSQADLVKFAKHLPALQDSENAYIAARRFVEETQPQPAAPGHSTEGPRAAA